MKRSLVGVLGFCFVALVTLTVACKKDPDPAATPQGYVPPNGQYPQQQQQYPQQPQQYPQQQQPQPGYPPPAQPGAPVPAAGGTMAVPGPLALPCQADSACGFAKCNVQYGKCAFPCAGPIDCAAGSSCQPMTGLCLPGAH